MKLLDLISPPFLERIQSLFSSYLGTSLMITDIHGTPLIRPISGVRMCSLVRNTPKGEILCDSSDRNGGHETLLSKKTHIYRCMAGFIDFSAAIEFRGEVIGLLVGGQVKTGDEDPASLGKISKDVGVPLEELQSAYQEMPCVGERELHEKLSFAKQVMEYLCDLSAVFYEMHMKDRKAVADATARAQAAEEVTDLFNRQLKQLAESFAQKAGAEADSDDIQVELEDMLRQADSVREVISEGPEFTGCSDKNYRIREVTYELQWVLHRVSAPYGEKVHIAEDESVPPYLCGDPAAISDVLNRILQFMTKKQPGRNLNISAGMRQDSYAALITICISSPGSLIPDHHAALAEHALDGDWEKLLGSNELEYVDLSSAAVVARKLSADLTCSNLEPEGFCFRFAIPQLPAKGGFY